MKQVEIMVNIYDEEPSKGGTKIFAMDKPSLQGIFFEGFKTDDEIWDFIDKNHKQIIERLKQK